MSAASLYGKKIKSKIDGKIFHPIPKTISWREPEHTVVCEFCKYFFMDECRFDCSYSDPYFFEFNSKKFVVLGVKYKI